MAKEEFTYLHVRSHYSLLTGGSSPDALVARAVELSLDSLAITDLAGVRGAVAFAKACQTHGIRPIYGAEVAVDNQGLVLICENAEGYGELCRLLSKSYENPLTLADLELAVTDHLFCLTGGRHGMLASAVRHSPSAARACLCRLKGIFGDRLSVELWHHLHEDDHALIGAVVAAGASGMVDLAVGGDIRFARPEDYARYDLLTCIGLGCTVNDFHEQRPSNAEGYLRNVDSLRRLLPYPHAFDRAAYIAKNCSLNLLPGHLIPPAPRLDDAHQAGLLLRRLCFEGLALRYRGSPRIREAQCQLEHELGTIQELGLDDFFLVVHEIIAEARRRGIRYAGRGSAANSIAAFVLGVTTVCPLEQNLLFERFLHRGRMGTPDIDVDFDSERREEIIAWIEQRFGPEHTAMTATLVRYGLRLAIRDAAKALGWPASELSRLSKAVPRRRSTRCVADYREVLQKASGDAPLVASLIDAVTMLDGVPRHLGLHNGGMILARTPLWHFSPVQQSANGVRMVQFDKDDVEALGLVKFDVLGLRMLAAVDMAGLLVEEHERGADFPSSEWIDHIPLEDPKTYRLIRRGQTLGVFQIESMGQMHLVASLQPRVFQDLVVQVALFRPGPLQGGMVHPYIRRRQGIEPVTFDHPLLEPILTDTHGVVLFQEQILEIAHQFAGMSLEEADAFRRLMSKYRDDDELAEMRARFISGAVEKGVPIEIAEKVFIQVSGYVGYGFCRSHAAAFARTVVQSAFLKTHHPAAYFAGFLEHHPGMYDRLTIEQEAHRFGVRMLRACVLRSSPRFKLELDERGQLAIRRPLHVVSNVSREDAAEVCWARIEGGDFVTVADFYQAVALDHEKLRSLAEAGALDDLAGDRRRALWELGVLEQRHGQPGMRQDVRLLDEPLVFEEDVPVLPPLSADDRLSWDLRTTGTTAVHPVAAVRPALTDLGISTIHGLQSVRRGRLVRVAGRVIMRQRPPTAKGVAFVSLEDETGIVQCIVYPKRLAFLDLALRESAVVVTGQLQAERNWRAVVVTGAWPLPDVLGGYGGHLQMGGGRDVFKKEAVRMNLDDEATHEVVERPGRRAMPGSTPSSV